MQNRKRHVSLKDLAQQLGVSISTVSRALNNHPDISPEITQKVKKLAADMNYTPNPLAMGLLKQATRMIGVIVPDLVTHFYSSVISGIEAMHMIHKGQAGTSNVTEEVALINQLFCLA